ncbi:MAG: protein kinase, partial [Gemmataceae bacterium]|nr:protein kinase [Gemmataceae bacterium]
MNWLRDPDTEPLPGYRLVEPLGSGGFGEVWKCVAPGGIPKAIKFVSGTTGTLDGDDPRAEQELKALGRVKEVRHPFVLSTEQVREVGGELVIVMELADRSLHDCLEEHQAAGRPGIPRDRLLGYLADAAAGLDHLNDAHSLQHLDVKPRNLFVVGERVKVADFGLVKHLDRLSGAGLQGGVTPAYAAPETLAGRVSPRTDQYSLAVVYVELLTGRRPFCGANVRQLAVQHMTEPPDLSGLPPADRPAVARALAKDPDARHPSCTAFVRALAECGGQTPHYGAGLRTEADFGVAPPPRTPPPTVHDVVRTPHPSDDDLLTPTVFTSGGGLRSAVLIGIGSYGRRALQEVRSRLADRVGDLAQVPALRFLYLDTAPDAAAKAAAARPAGALAPDEVVP